MLRTTIYQYYSFGYNYGLLKRHALSAKSKKDALKDLSDFFDFLRSADLPVTIQVASDLAAIHGEIEEGADERVTAAMSTRIRQELERIDPALDAELQLRAAYVMTKKRFPLETLLEEVHLLLGEGVHRRLSRTAQKDFSLACRNIALNTSTSAAFHLMRAMEQQVKELYCAFKKTKRLDKPMWGPMIQQLRTKRAPKPSSKLLDHLDSMRKHFRNPTQHPDAFFTIDEAQDLLSQTIVAMNMIDAEMPKLQVKDLV